MSVIDQRRFLFAAILVLAALSELPRDAQAQATAKPEYIYNQQEREAAEVVKAWVAAWSAHDVQKMADYMSDDCVFRGDPSQKLQTGRAAFMAEISRFIQIVDSMKIDELFVTGTEWNTAVLIKRSDTIRANSGSRAAGRTVPFAAFFRVKNKKITEWLDTPIVSLPAASASAPPGN
jgi:uncharacterized protein (TIGR02246 family)